MSDIPAMRVEFYERGGGLVDALRSYAVPQQGEYINIAKQQWRVAYVAWAIDSNNFRPQKELRANVELEKVPNDEAGPAGSAETAK
ncbi:hypothetical protein [Parvibaculum sp. MBR-TMA-1.3b-4.2]|jgi:hypothetical protein